MAVTAVRDRILTYLLGVSLLVPVVAAGAENSGFAQSPLFLNEPAADSMAFVLDDSASADFELQVPGTRQGALERDGFSRWLGELLDGSDVNLFESIAQPLLRDIRYGYLFEPGLADTYDGRRINPEYHVVPPLAKFGFLRSAAWNPQFYNPGVDYEPWPYPVPDGMHTMPPASTSDPKLDPLYGQRMSEMRSDSGFANWLRDGADFLSDVECFLTSWFTDCEANRPMLDVQYRPFTVSGELRDAVKGVLDSAGTSIKESTLGLSPGSTFLDRSACAIDEFRNDFGTVVGEETLFNQNSVCMPHVQASYYVPQKTGSYRWEGDLFGVLGEGECGSRQSDDFVEFIENFDQEALRFEDAQGNQFPGALAPDGTCLRRVNLSDPDAVRDLVQERYGRTYEEELQNFANWFTYHRRRHQSLRAALGETAVRVDNLRGMPVLTNSASGDLPLYDLQDRSGNGGLDRFLAQIYTGYNGATDERTAPLRSTLNHVGEQFERSDDNAPVTASCQQNIAGLYSDGYSTDGTVSAVGNADGGAGGPFSDGARGTLADVAWNYYDELEVPGLENGNVPVPDACSERNPAGWLDCNRDLHLNTFGVTTGHQGANVWGWPMPGTDDGYERRRDAHQQPPQWWPVSTDRPGDNPGSAAQRDDLYHAATNGFGELFSADDAVNAASSLNNALNRPSTLNAWESAATPEAVEISQREGLVYSASFNPRDWEGRLTARRADLTATDSDDPQDQVLGEVLWDAGTVLDERNLQSNPRTILTAGADGEPVAFEPDNLDQLPDEARADLSAGGDRATAEDRIAYLAGRRNLEGERFRERGGRLGDIVHSNPVHVGRPAMGWPDEAPYGTEDDRYSDYLAAQRDRERTIYAGANDGMLHAFDGTPDDSGGGERFAYIPSFAFDDAESRGFSYLTSPQYQHRYSVDLAPAVSDAHIQTDPDAGPEWHSVLVGGMRTGGRGLFALDVTDPDVASSDSPEDLLLWEFQHQDLGTLNKPVNIVLMPWDDGHEWVAVFGNGYNAPSGRSGVFMLRLEGGLDGEWSRGTDYRFIETGGDGLPGVTSDVTPVDTDRDRVPDRLYASDREGRIWVLVENSGSWVAKDEPLFRTPGGQPITTGVTVTGNRFVPDEDSNAPNLLVFFGTGQYLSTGDLSDTTTQSFYGVWDHGGTGINADQLQVQDLTESVAGQTRTRSLSGDEVAWGRNPTDDHGWYFDFDTRIGERVVERPRLRNGQLRFNTTIPETDPCSAGGSSFRMFVDLDGSNPDEPNVDDDNDGELEDEPSAGTEHDDGLLSGGSGLLDVQVDNSTDEEKDEETRITRTSEPAIRRGRLGWQELVRPR